MRKSQSGVSNFGPTLDERPVLTWTSGRIVGNLILPDYVRVARYTATGTKLAHKLGIDSYFEESVQCNYGGAV
jgi:hypothetical protein